MMHTIRKILLMLLALLVGSWAVGCAEEPAPADPPPVWGEDFKQALAASAKTGRPVLADFTGSDWCPPCQMLKKKVFQTQRFADWARSNVVLLKVDFPRGKPQPPEIRNQNRRLAERYGDRVKGFPTILFLDAEGQVLGAIGGYDRSGPTESPKGRCRRIDRHAHALSGAVDLIASFHLTFFL